MRAYYIVPQQKWIHHELTTGTNFTQFSSVFETFEERFTMLEQETDFSSKSSL